MPQCKGQTDAAGTGSHSPPKVATVGITLLHDLRRALRGADCAEIERLSAELEQLIAAAAERAWAL